MKKILSLTSTAAVVLAGTYAVAQSINKSEVFELQGTISVLNPFIVENIRPVDFGAVVLPKNDGETVFDVNEGGNVTVFAGDGISAGVGKSGLLRIVSATKGTTLNFLIDDNVDDEFDVQGFIAALPTGNRVFGSFSTPWDRDDAMDVEYGLRMAIKHSVTTGDHFVPYTITVRYQ